MCATEGFTPISAAIGGLILSIAVTLLFWVTGHITGISSILEGLLYGRNLSTNWRLSWMAGFVGAVLLLNSEMPELLDQGSMRSPNWIYVVSGFCIGLGSRVASGCTSGHGLCGTALLSRRSVTATLVFLCTAFLTATSMSLNGKAEEFQAQPFDKFWDVPLENSRNISTALVVLISLISVKSFFSKKGFLACISGGLFATGLVLGGMGRRPKIAAFVTLGPCWDPSLMVVLGVGVLLSHLGLRLAIKCTKKSKTIPSGKLPKGTVLDESLVIGAGIFGVGWGSSGICPGPAMIIGAMGDPKILYAFTPAMIVGIYMAAGTRRMLNKLGESLVKNQLTI